MSEEGLFKKRIKDFDDSNGDAGVHEGCEYALKVVDDAKKELDDIIQEIERNATEDTLFERMTLTRIKDFRKKQFGEKEK